MTGSIIVVGGGVRSGKSAFALTRARALGGRLGFIATAQAFDAEMTARIADHVRTRGPDFHTLEDMERHYIHQVIERVDGNKSKAAKILGISRQTLRRKVERS